MACRLDRHVSINVPTCVKRCEKWVKNSCHAKYVMKPLDKNIDHHAYYVCVLEHVVPTNDIHCTYIATTSMEGLRSFQAKADP